MKPYYQDASCVIYHGDCREVLPTLAEKSAGLVLTDPPPRAPLLGPRRHGARPIRRLGLIRAIGVEIDERYCEIAAKRLTQEVFDLADVLTYGAAKYEPWQWARGMDWSRAYAAAQRHLNAFWAGEDNDPESGLPHLGHALCCLMFLAHYAAHGHGHDDRWRAE